MSRLTARAAVVAAAVAFASAASGQPPDPLDLARGLRESRMPDLALEYLADLTAKKPAPAVAAVLPLERAIAKLDLADDESDEGKRSALIAEARAGFEQFLATNPNHPRRPEAAVALARVVSVQAKGLLARANKSRDKQARKSELTAARPVFQDAGKRFGQAAAEFAKKLEDPGLTPSARRGLTRDVYQAELDRAVNLLLLARTYDPPEGDKERQARADAINQAQKLFTALADRDPSHPLCWVARAWTGECEREKDSPVEAQKIFDAVKKAASSGGPAVAGARTARFFELGADYLKANTPAEFRRVQAGLEQWLADPAARAARPAPEVFAARFYLGEVKRLQAVAMIKLDKSGKPGPVPAAARDLLQSAEKDFKRLQEPENDYSDRAAERRTQTIRILIGDGLKDPARIVDLEECLMAAQVQLYRAVKDEKLSTDERTKSLRQVIALYERARQLPVPRELAKDAADAQVNLVFAYLMADRAYQAAVLGEHLARTARAGAAARAGMYALQAYLTSAGKADAADTASRRADLDRALAVGYYLDKQYPNDANTDGARILLGQQLLREGQHQGAFDLLARVGPGSPRVLTARLIEAAAAYELVRPQQAAGPDGGKSSLTPAQKAAVYNRAVADLTAVPDLPAAAPAADARLASLLDLQLAELYLTDKPNGYPRAEKAAAAATARIAAYIELPAEEKQELAFRAEYARVRAIYGQIYPLFQAGQYAKVMARLAPVLAAMAKDGPAAKPDAKDGPAAAAARRLDEFRRNELIVLALQCRIKEGAVDKAGELFDLLKKFGGTLEASIGAMSKLLDVVQPQIALLRREGKADEAARLAAGVGQLLDKVANEPNVSPAVLVFLGRGLREIGNYDKAIEYLKKVSVPAEGLDKPLAELDDKTRLPVVRYRSARLEMARCHRMAKHYAEADAILKDALGTKEKRGWGATDLSFRKEAAHLLEARASDLADPKEAVKLWSEANQLWSQMGREYQSVLVRPYPKDEKARNDLERLKAQVKPIYHDLFFEQIRCVTKANLQLLKSNPTNLTARLTGVARQMTALEKANPDLSPDVKARFAELLEEVPALKDEYSKLDGPKGLLRQNLGS
jgi:hypothetical protein